jgi:benzylsuccinate CoA-transferase BbsF subunit
VAQKSEDLYCDPQLAHRGFFWEAEHPVMGRHRLESEAFIFSKTPSRLRMPSACMGEHTEWVCREILGLSDEQFVEYLAEGVFE